MNKPLLFQSSISKVSYKKYVHSSGLTLYFMEMKDRAKKAAMISAKFGSIHFSFKDPEGNAVTVPNGTAHFLEHKLFEGEHGGAFEYYGKTGAKANAYTSNDKTSYYFICTDHFERNLDCLLRFITNPYLTDENVEKEKGIIAQEIKMYDDEPVWQGYFSMVRGLYRNHPIRRDIAGTVEEIQTLTPKLLKCCYKTYYHPSNMVLSVAGDINPETVLKAADRYFEKASPFSIQSPQFDEPEESGLQYTEKEMLVSKPIFHLGFKDIHTDISGYSLSKKEMEVEILLEYLFGRSSPFFLHQYECGNINGEYDCWYDLSDYFSFCVLSGESNDPRAVEEAVSAQVEQFLRDGVDHERFVEIRNGLYGSLMAETDQAFSMVNRMAGNYLNQSEMIDAFEALLKITDEDLLKRAKEIFRKECSCLSVILPVKE